MDTSKFVSRLWGDHFFDAKTKKWIGQNVSESGQHLLRGFCKLVLEPIGIMMRAILDGDEKWKKYVNTCGIRLTEEEMRKEKMELAKAVMQKWMPLRDSVFEMVCAKLPSPAEAQMYRCQVLYCGEMGDATAVAIRQCDPNGPLCMYVSKMVESEIFRFFAFGRVFSGTITAKMDVRIMGPEFEFGKKNDLTVKTVQKIVMVVDKRTEEVGSVSCGNLCALVGMDQFMTKCGTIGSDESSYPLKNMKFSISPVAKVAVECKNPADLPKLVEGLKRLNKSDLSIQINIEESGEHVIVGDNEMHLETCIKNLKEKFMNNIPLLISDPIVSYRETVTAPSE